jgi:hypothetical protein
MTPRACGWLERQLPGSWYWPNRVGVGSKVQGSPRCSPNPRNSESQSTLDTVPTMHSLLQTINHAIKKLLDPWDTPFLSYIETCL